MSDYRLMGILNVTPDSFSDGGAYLDADEAVVHGLGLVDDGADILDVGGESTRPGAEPVGIEEELRRVVPVIERLASELEAHRFAESAQGGAVTQISIDTSKAPVAQAALAAGASFVNDVTALRGDPEMVAVVAAASCDCCLMHMQGEPRTMQREPRYDDVVGEVKSFLEERLAFAVSAGIEEDRVLLDPGIGFGKRREHNFELLRRLDEIAAIGRPVVIGTSRKSFLGAARLEGTIATNVLALERGASVFRVHDVAPVSAALRIAADTLTGTVTASEAST